MAELEPIPSLSPRAHLDQCALGPRILEAKSLFGNTLAWLQENYLSFRFFVERDLVWTVQRHLLDTIAREKLELRVFNDHPMLPGNRRSLSADIAVLDANRSVLLALEFKYEPNHSRADLLRHKLPVTGWCDMKKDIERCARFVAERKAAAACAVFLDEGGYFRDRQPHEGSRWIDWTTQVTDKPVSVLLSAFPDELNLTDECLIWPNASISR